MAARLSALVIWAAVAASAVFWALRLFVAAPALPAGTAVAESAQAARGDVVRLLGAAPVPVAAAPLQAPPESSRFRLSGVMAPRSAGQYGVALIAVDGKPPRAFRVGARVDGDWVLQSVSLRTATVGAAGAAPGLMMELPPLPPPNTGSLPPIGATGFSSGPGAAAMLGAPGIPPQPGAEPPMQNINEQVAPITPPPPALAPRSPLGRGMPSATDR